jgi:hypothetical protein
MEIRPLVRTLTRRASLLVAVAGAAVIAACSADPVASGPELTRRSEVLPPTGAVKVKVLPRKAEQEKAETGTLTITSAKGGSIVLPGAGVRLDVPAGAIRSGSVTIVMTATPGRMVAYEFQPHGLKFAKQVMLYQDLDQTLFQAGLTLWGGYNLESVDQAKGQVTSLESVLATVATDRKTGKTSAAFPIWHFSGYVLTSGRAEDDPAGGLGM